MAKCATTLILAIVILSDYVPTNRNCFYLICRATQFIGNILHILSLILSPGLLVCLRKYSKRALYICFVHRQKWQNCPNVYSTHYIGCTKVGSFFAYPCTRRRLYVETSENRNFYFSLPHLYWHCASVLLYRFFNFIDHLRFRKFRCMEGDIHSWL